MSDEEAEEEPQQRDDVIEWWSVTDEELHGNFKNVKNIPKEGYKELSVHGYENESLKNTPKVSVFSHFQMLVLLDLRWNRITELVVSDLPVTLEVIILSHNEFQKLPALSRLSRLKSLDMSNNKLMAVDPNMPDSIEVVNLSYNNIQVFPSFDNKLNLRELYLNYNYIHHISSNQLPVNVHVMDLSHNYLHASLNLGRMGQLKKCNLSYNKLKQLHPDFPSTLEVLDVSYNNIQIIPSLAGTCLRHLNLTDTITVRILGLPGTLEVILLTKVTSLKVFTEECFPSQAVYDVIKKFLTFSQVHNLAQPAPHVFIQGYAHLMRYFTGNFTCNSRNRIILTGEPESGKTSLARTLNKGRPTMTHSERTQFIKITTWKIDEETSFRIYDHGGYDTDTIINHLFASNKSNVLVCHDLSSRGDVERSLDHFHHMLKLQPENHIHFALTHVDKLYTQVYFESLNQLKKAVSTFWNEEINELKSKMDSSNKEQIQNLIALYKQRKESLKYFPISCKTNKGIQDLKDYLIKSTDENRVIIPDYWLHVYTSLKQTSADFLTFKDIENILRKLDQVNDRDAETTKGNTETAAGETEIVGGETETKAGETETKSGETETAPGETEIVGGETDTKAGETETKTGETDIVGGENETTAGETETTAGEAETIAGKTEAKAGKTETIASKTEDCLRYFNDLDILVWQHQELYNYVFHNLGFLIDLFAKVFMDDLEEYLDINYIHNEAIHDKLPVEEIQNMLLLHRKGLLEKQLICILWRKYYMNAEDTDALLGVMKSFNLLYPITGDSELYYCPWKVTDNEGPEWFSVEAPVVIDKDHVTLQLQCQFYNGIPSHVCKMLCVCLQRYAVQQNYKGHRHPWKEGLMVTIDKNKCYVYRDKKAGTLNCVVQCPIQGLAKGWETLHCLHKDLQQILTIWRGLLMTAYIVCVHCGVIRIKHPYKWPTHVVWPVLPDNKAVTDYVMCPYDLGEDVPTGLIQSISQGNDSQVEIIEEYLKENWIDFKDGQELSDKMKSHLRSKLPHFQSIMCIDPVIKGLHQGHLISDKYKDKLDTLKQSAKVESMVKKLVLRRTRDDMAKFRQVLVDTDYHTNVTLAKLIPYGDVIPKDPEELLTKSEEKMIKERFFKVFSDDIGVEKVIPHLQENRALHETHYNGVKDKITSQGKAVYLLDNVLYRGTYQTVHKFRKALLKCNSKHMAKLLPERNGYVDSADSDSDISEIDLDDTPNKKSVGPKTQNKQTKKKGRHKDTDQTNRNINVSAGSRQTNTTDRTTEPPSASTTRSRHGRSTLSNRSSSFQAYEGEVQTKSKLCVIS